MSNLAKILSILMVSLAAGKAFGVTAPPMSPPGPFVNVTIPKDPLHLSGSWESGGFQASGKVDIRVVANCPYRIVASFRDLAYGTGGAAIPPTNLSVAINGQRTALGEKVAVAQSWQPAMSGVNVPVELQVGLSSFVNCRAGRYNGSLVITVMAAP